MKLTKKVLNYHTCFKAESDQFTLVQFVQTMALNTKCSEDG